jgi:hypothetical protein
MPFGKASSAEVSRLIEEKMRSCPIGDTVTFGQMAEIRGFNKNSNRGPLTDALKRLHDDGVFFINERTIGYQRLAREQWTIINFKRKKKIAKSARVGVKDCKKMMEGFGNDGMSNASKIQISRDQTNFGLIGHLASGKFSPNVVNKDNEIKPLPLRQSAAAFYEQICGKR